MTDATLNEIAKLINKLKFPIDRNAFIKRLQEQVEALSQKDISGRITPKIEELILLGLVTKLTPQSLILPNKELGKKFYFIKNEQLRDQLEEDYYSMEMQEQLGNIYEFARFAHVQIENIINCSFFKYNILDTIKKYSTNDYVWVSGYYSGVKYQSERVHPAEYLLGNDTSKWSNYAHPSSPQINYIKKLVLYFAFCINKPFEDGYKSGLIEPRFFKEINEIKKLRDKASHRFSNSTEAFKSDLLLLTPTDAFTSIKNTLRIFIERNRPKDL